LSYTGGGLAFDRAGNLYETMYNDNTVVKFTPGGVMSVFASDGLDGPAALAFDAAGNLYVGNTNIATIEKFTPDGVGSVFANVGSEAIAFDSAGNLYTPYGDSIWKFTPSGVGSAFAPVVGGQVMGLAFTDDAGVPLPLPIPEPGFLGALAIAAAMALRPTLLRRIRQSRSCRSMV
jgi:hypothetical protein